MNNRIENLVSEWDHASIKLLLNKEYQIPQIEELLRETYKLCTEYKDADCVPKEFCELFIRTNIFAYYLADALDINADTTPSDGAEYDAITHIMDEIEYGFLSGNYESAFPYLSVDNNNCKSYVLHLEEAFLEDFIDNNR